MRWQSAEIFRRNESFYYLGLIYDMAADLHAKHSNDCRQVGKAERYCSPLDGWETRPILQFAFAAAI